MMSAHPGAASAPIPPGQRWLADVGPGCATFLARARPSSVAGHETAGSAGTLPRSWRCV